MCLRGRIRRRCASTLKAFHFAYFETKFRIGSRAVEFLLVKVPYGAIGINRYIIAAMPKSMHHYYYQFAYGLLISGKGVHYAHLGIMFIVTDYLWYSLRVLTRLTFTSGAMLLASTNIS